MPLDYDMPQPIGSIVTPEMEAAGAAVLAAFPGWVKTRPATLAHNVFVAMMKEYDPSAGPDDELLVK